MPATKPPLFTIEEGMNPFPSEKKYDTLWISYLGNEEFKKAWHRLITEQKNFKRKSTSQLVFNAEKLLKYPIEFAIEMVNDCWDKEWKGTENPGTEAKYHAWMAKQPYEISNPFSDEIFTAWNYWKEHFLRKFNTRYDKNSEQIEIDGLYEMSGGDEETAKQIIKQSIHKHWKSFYPLKEQNKQLINDGIRENVQAEFVRRYGTTGT